jgi:dTDP-4-dehydrorhamnose 3,5-epimerase
MLISGNSYTDQRGTIRFVNDFAFNGIKRFYSITHHNMQTVRAWQGHKLETKYIYVTQGCFLVNWIEIDNWEQPSKHLVLNKHTLKSTQSEILIIPSGHVSGFKALEPDSTMIVFSDMSLEDSKMDDYRFPVDYWEVER